MHSLKVGLKRCGFGPAGWNWLAAFGLLFIKEFWRLTRLATLALGLFFYDSVSSKAADSIALPWSWLPIPEIQIPSGARHPVDAFIVEKLKSRGLGLSRETDRRTLLRRLYYDLIGLPPTYEEVTKFVEDARPDAYERLVDRLLASTSYGERWARHWLDTIHFADSHGYEHDIARDNAWPFRDYVIEALNRDTSWGRMIREQLAADTFFPNEPQLTRALGFLGAGTFDLSTFSTAVATFDYLDRDDLVNQTMAAFLSTTANCARCHDHKFDPVSQEDYYALQAVFSGLSKGDVFFDSDPSKAADRKLWTQVLEQVAQNQLRPSQLQEHPDLLERWITQLPKTQPWKQIEVGEMKSSEGSILQINEAKEIIAEGKRPEKDVYTIRIKVSGSKVNALRLDVLSRPDLPKKGPGRQDNGNFHLSEIEVWHYSGTVSNRVRVSRATADFNQAEWGIEKAIDGNLSTAWGIYPKVGESHHAIFEFEKTLELGISDSIELVLRQSHGGGHLIGGLKIFWTDTQGVDLAVFPVEIEKELDRPFEAWKESTKLRALGLVLEREGRRRLAELGDPEVVYAAGRKVRLVNGEAAGLQRTLDSPKMVHLLNRGEFDKPLREIGPGSLERLEVSEALPRWSTKLTEQERRRILADWIANRSNPLTWRSIVNRVWHYHFGRGMSDSPNDLGTMGGKVSHPELLDWLARWFRDEADGSLKSLHRLIVTSQTYRQSSHSNPAGEQVDSENIMLWRQNRHRLDADTYRDYAMSVSKRLLHIGGGPGVRHFSAGKGPQLTPALQYRAYDWNQKQAARRSIYRFVWRGIPDPFMESLDFPDLGLLSPTRVTSVSALQALGVWNNEFVLSASSWLANQSDQSHRDSVEPTVRMLRFVLQRDPSPGEQFALSNHSRAHGLEALARVLLNSNEFLFVD